MSFEIVADEAHIKREKDKARQMRKSNWWHSKIQNATCYYCQKSINREEATMDHIVPISRGGKTTKGNIAVACKCCNTLKRDKTAVEWEEYLNGLD